MYNSGTIVPSKSWFYVWKIGLVSLDACNKNAVVSEVPDQDTGKSSVWRERRREEERGREGDIMFPFIRALTLNSTLRTWFPAHSSISRCQLTKG